MGLHHRLGGGRGFCAGGPVITTGGRRRRAGTASHAVLQYTQRADARRLLVLRRMRQPGTSRPGDGSPLTGVGSEVRAPWARHDLEPAACYEGTFPVASRRAQSGHRWRPAATEACGQAGAAVALGQAAAW